MSNKELPNVKHDSELQRAITGFGTACAYNEVEQRIAAALKLEDAICNYARAALAAQPVAPKGWKQIGWTCDEGACGRIHDESSTADPEFTQPVYVAVEASKPERKTLHVCTLECGDTYITSGSAEAEIGETPEVIESFDMPAFAVDLILKSLPEYDNG